MDRFEQFKSKFPEFSNLSNGEIVNLVSQYTGADPQRVYSEFGGEQNRSAVGDLGTALKIGAQRLPETVTGLGDVLVAPITGRASISDAADSLGRATGFRPGQWANDSQLNYSQAQQQFLQQGAQTEGFADTAAHYLTNPMRSVVQGVESVPGMALGGVYARGLRGLGSLGNAARFGAGEGGVMAGQAMNQMVDDGVDPARAAGYAAGIGALGGALGYGGGRLAERLGVVNPDELLGFGGRTALAEGATAPGLGRRVAGGMLSEGAFEEMPQSAMEAAMGNLAAERPWDQDVGKQAAAGLVLGGLLGGVVGVVPPARNPADPIDLLNRDTTPQSEAAPQVGQSELNFDVTGEEAIGTRGLRNPFDAAGYVSGFQQGQETTVDVPQSDLFGGANERPPVDIPRPPKIDIPVPQPLQSDPVRSAVAQASPATLRKDGSLKDIVEKALGAYSEFSDGEIAAALEEFASSKRKDTVWRVAALEAIARQRAAQGAPNVAQVDAASGQGAGAVPAGSAGNTPSGPVVLDGVRQPAGAPAPSSAARVPVGDPVVQQPASVADQLGAASTPEEVQQILLSADSDALISAALNRPDLLPKIQSGMSPPAWEMFSADVAAAQQEAQPTNVPPVEQVAAQAEEARGQEGAQVGAEQSRDAERAQVSRIFDTLSEREREILTKYHFDKMTFEEIGSELKERGESGTTRQRIDQQHKEALRKLAEAGRPFGLTQERLRLYFPDESRRMAGGADVQTASAAEVAQSGAGMTYRDESNNGAVNQANDEFEMADAVDGAEALDLDTDIAREEFDEGFRGEQGADVDALEQVEAVESMARTERDHNGQEITEEAVRIAGLEYDQDLQEGDVPFAQLDSADQIRYTKAAIAFNDEVLSAQQLMRVFGEIADGARQQASQPQRAVEEAGAVAQVQGAVPARDAGEARQETDAREEVTDAVDSDTAGFGEGNRYSRTTGTQGTTVEAVRSAINDIATPAGNRKITVVQSADELIERGILNSSQARGTQGYVTRKGDAYFIADNIRPGNELAVVLHEIGAHLGIEKLLTDAQYEALVKKIFAWAQSDANTQEARIARAALARVDAAKLENEADLAPETIAYFIEEAVKAGVNPTAMQYKTELGRWFRTLWAAFKVALRRLNLINADRLTAQNVVDLAYGAARIELASAYHGTAANFRRFDHRFMGSGEGAQAFGWGTYLAQRFGIANEYFVADVRRKVKLPQGIVGLELVDDILDPEEGDAIVPAGTKIVSGKASPSWLVEDGQVSLGTLDAIRRHYGFDSIALRDPRTGDVRTVTTAEPEGNIHITDVNATEDELLDWFEPISKQSPQVREALETLTLPDSARFTKARDVAKIEFTETTNRYDEIVLDGVLGGDALTLTVSKTFGGGERVSVRVSNLRTRQTEFSGTFDSREAAYDAVAGFKSNLQWRNMLAADPKGSSAYKFLEDALGSDKAASEHLDSLGVKGIKFLDAMSRGQKRDIVDKTGAPVPTPTRPTPGVRSALTFVTGFDSMADALAEARKQAETYPSMSELVDVLAYWVGKGYQLKAADQTSNLVVFNDRNIYRVGSMRGGPVGKGGRMMFSKTADPQLTELAHETGQRALKAIQAGIRKGWTGLAFSSHLANAAHRAGLTSARALELVQRKKATRAYEIQIEVEKVLSKFAGLKGQINGRPTSEVVQRFIYDSTFDKKWGFAPDWKQDAVVDPEMESRFNALPTEAQTVIKDVFRHGDAIFKEKQDLLRKTITGEYEALIKAETDDGKRRKLERQRDKELREAGRLIAEMNGPYAPLRRYGNYVVVAKSQKYRDMEAAGPVDAELKRDENHYVVEFAETLYEAERLQGVLEGKFGKGLVWAGEKETATEQFGELPFMAVQRLRKMVDTDLDGDLNTKSKRVLNKLLVDLYISTLHEANARHSEQKRQFVNRADRDTAAKDMMRAFATQGRADSHLVSALQFNSEIVDEMQKLRNEAKNGQGDSLLKTRLRNEILQRHMMDLDFRETPVQDKLMSLNSFWMLLTSPGYYVQNATQVMMMTQPVLAGKFGQNRSMRQLMRGYQDAMRVLKGSSWNEAADLSRFNGTADEKAMLIELQARGTLDFGISAELGYWESRGEISKVFNQVMRKVGMATRKLEVLNRMSSALAAYRLMYDQTTGTQAKRHAAALDYADSIIKDTHGDYSSTNAPRYLRMMPKVMTQFRKFQLIQLSLFAKVIHGSVKGSSPQEKRVMLATMGYLFMNHALLAGAVGVPASALLGAIYAIAGDDDDPNDWEVDVRRAIGDKEMADLILHGLPSLININMSNKIGAGTMLDPLPFAKYEATRGGYEKVVTAATGPLIGGLGAQVVDAFGRILNGDVAQGTAQLLPRGFRDAARGFMAAQDGIKLRNGQTALTPEELSFYDSLMMGLGLPTLKTTSRTETQFKSQQYEQFFKTRVTKIKRQYSEAYEDNDREAMLEARQAWAEMQASRKNLGFKVQPLSELLKAPREKAKAEAKLENGIRTTEQARGFVQSLQ